MRHAAALALLGACTYVTPNFGGDDEPGPVDAAVDGKPDAPPDAFACPVGYAPLPGGAANSLYRVSGGDGGTPSPSPGRATWLAAEADCRDDGPGIHLAIAETEPEHAAFVDVVAGASRWLGVTDRKTADIWLPIIGGTTYVAHWFDDAPAMHPTNNCLLLTRVIDSGTNLAEATPCNGEGSLPSNQWDKGYICECDGSGVDQSSF